MATHMLARLRDVPLGTIRDLLRADAEAHAAEGLHLQHVRRFIDRVHGEARRADPHATLPEMTFLVG